MDETTGRIIYRSKRSVKVGQLERFTINYEPKPNDSIPPQSSVWLKIRNLENITLRAAFLRGPYILYADVRSGEYHHSQSTFITADQPRFDPNLLPGQSFTTELSMHTIKDRYVWVVEIISQIIFSPSTDISFEVLLGTTKSSLDSTIEKLGTFDDQLQVNRLSTIDLWNLPIPNKDKPIHLVILTHGLHSNTGADMFYIKDQLDSMAAKTGENLIVRGYHDNVCKTEKGIKYLGTQLAKYVVQQLKDERITKISFIGHSLGGIIQIFAITYIELNCPWIFKKVKPVNFITLATPFLGIVTDNPAYIKAALMVGVVGKTGQDLGLAPSNGDDPLLLKLSKEKATHRVLKMFDNRTIYANAFNDGIVPLYTSALLYLDWRGLSKISDNPETPNDDKTGKIPNSMASENKDNSTPTNPFQKAMSMLAPNVQSSQEKKEDSSNFPKTSMIESASSVLIPPLPSQKYLIDPNSRDEVIIHDKVYTSDDIPPPKLKKRTTFMDKINYDPLAGFKDLEEEIAKNWHDDLSWRKILVKLKPDAHNNIFVRRRFSNAYGWPVIDHLIDEHFSKPSSTVALTDGSKSCSQGTEQESLEKLSNEDIDLGNDFKLSKDYDWVLKETPGDGNGLFDVGPTGMLTNVNEIFDNFKNFNINNYIDDYKVNENGDVKPKINDEEMMHELELNTNISEGYIP